MYRSIAVWQRPTCLSAEFFSNNWPTVQVEYVVSCFVLILHYKFCHQSFGNLLDESVYVRINAAPN
jgi:hypothetical protein